MNFFRALVLLVGLTLLPIARGNLNPAALAGLDLTINGGRNLA